ncbi:MAG: hypothetical protein ACD_16C00018G0009 [uncultured bacterium]|nr:MAG: hypothetical protein ACD_16C00018G0009 [uncultured bacterium]OFW69288.1 MAG: hypothetical protein A2X70_03685 [Alphaproteobacteria bacterium GWC2_42_16]OFW73685.1 MAG: hypothetical protein A2Z80_06090 [Alphaproteobacteria bacterium GWA2_41_27]OFW81991.1 MAG: hypothetical protein A3E50_05390 [Alphaproteobacteria bacterium RIFCSPHIGHO2_12_FULL_42_100]OFW86031.1 MAG: hypothetical protein A2W06_07650 [Alphaproteobacteria bacterium RBG_16_42_14]OFW91157.1 MAG: hypothetical protein A3C41_073
MSKLKISRRKFLIGVSSFVATAATPAFVASSLSTIKPQFSSKKLSLYNVHTGEDFEGIYWRAGHYDEKALGRLADLLRDRRNNQKHPIDAHLFDLLHKLQSTLGTKEFYTVICGYRSPQTNAALRKLSNGVAKNSLHLKGKAIDIRLEHTSLKELCQAARSLKAGGVGYYPKSKFVHVDIRPKPAFWT